MVALRYLASAPGAAEMNRPLPLVSPPEGRSQRWACIRFYLLKIFDRKVTGTYIFTKVKTA